MTDKKKLSHDNLYCGVIVTQLLRGETALQLTDHGQNDVCSF